MSSVGFYYCGYVSTFPIFHREATQWEQPACRCLACSLMHWGHLAGALLCPLLCTYLRGSKIAPKCNVRGIAQSARLPIEEPEMSLRCFFPPNSTTCRPFSVCLSLRDAWHMGEGAVLRTCQTESTR